MPEPKFKLGDRVKIVAVLDTTTTHELIGKVGTIREVDPLANGHFNYYLDAHYMHEEELEAVEPQVLIVYSRPNGGWLFHAMDASKLGGHALCGFTPARGWVERNDELSERDAPCWPCSRQVGKNV